jgi:DDE superfamily endonuclease
MRFIIKQKGGVNTTAIIEFVTRLIANAKREIFLIVDCGPAHIAKKTSAFVESLKGKLQLFYLPPYAPEFGRRSGYCSFFETGMNTKIYSTQRGSRPRRSMYH